MRQRDKEIANDKRQELFEAADWCCVVCGRWLRDGVPQLAHRVIKSGFNLRTYGDAIINHQLNVVPVENTDSCNAAVILNGQLAGAHLDRIKRVIAGEEPEPDMREEYAELRRKMEERRR